jgi:hypothetical protein
MTDSDAPEPAGWPWGEADHEAEGAIIEWMPGPGEPPVRRAEVPRGPTTNDRDAEADLALCEAATPGPWAWEDDPATLYSGRDGWSHGLNLLGRMQPDMNGNANLDFIAAARDALPHWIARALAAEARVAELEGRP